MNKVNILITTIAIMLFSCGQGEEKTSEKQDELKTEKTPEENVKQEETPNATVQTVKEKSLITDNSVGFFKTGEKWQEFATKHYKYVSIQGRGTCMDACCDGGFQLGDKIVDGEFGKTIQNLKLTIGAATFGESKNKNEHQNNENVFFNESENCAGWYWKNKIYYIIVNSDTFKTKEGLGVGTTLEKLNEINEVAIKIGGLDEDQNAIKVKISSYPNIDFILDVEDAVGGYDKLSALIGKSAKIADFKENAKIKAVIIRSEK